MCRDDATRTVGSPPRRTNIVDGFVDMEARRHEQWHGKASCFARQVGRATTNRAVCHTRAGFPPGVVHVWGEFRWAPSDAPRATSVAYLHEPGGRPTLSPPLGSTPHRANQSTGQGKNALCGERIKPSTAIRAAFRAERPPHHPRRTLPNTADFCRRRSCRCPRPAQAGSHSSTTLPRFIAHKALRAHKAQIQRPIRLYSSDSVEPGQVVRRSARAGSGRSGAR